MSLFGYVFGVGIFLLGMHQGGTTSLFLNEHAVVLVLGGTFAAVMISSSFEQTVVAFKSLKILFYPKKYMPAQEIIDVMVGLAEKARRDGVGSLPEEAKKYNEPFLSNSVQLVADGLPSATVQEIIEMEINNTRDRHKENSNFYRVAGIYGPMFGLLGTLIGIVQVLRNIGGDPTTVGPAMAVAITTAFYGIFLANFVCMPIANKLKLRSDEELALKELTIVGLIAIESGDLPLVVRRKMETFLSYSQKKKK